MVATIAWIELRQQLRGPVLWVVFAISSLMVGGSLGIDALRVGLGSTPGEDGDAIVVRINLVWSLFYLFTAAALVGDAVLRDQLTGFAPLVDATPVDPAAYVLGRYAGAFGALILCFLSVPLTLGAAALLPGMAPAIGAVPISTFIYALVVLAAPNLLLGASLFFVMAVGTRSMMGCYIGAVSLLTLYELRSGSGFPAILEPFGFLAQAQGLAAVGVNRLLWIMISLTGLALGALLQGRRPAGGSREAHKNPAVPAAIDRRRSPLWWVPRGPAAMVQLLVRTRHELRQLVLTSAFAVLLLMGSINAAAQLWSPAVAGEAETRLLMRLVESFRLVPVVIAIAFAGELVWNDRQAGMAEIVSSTPASRTVLLLAKALALGAVMLGMAITTAAIVVGVEYATGATPDLGVILGSFALPKSADWTAFAILALAIQMMSPTKLAGWGFLILYLIVLLALNQLGWTNPSYRFGGYPGWPVPPELSGLAGASAIRGYWYVAAGLLLLLCCILAARDRSPISVRD